MIPHVDVGALFGPASTQRHKVDDAVMQAATQAGFMTIGGLEGEVPVGAQMRARLLRIFDLPDPAKQLLWRKAFDASRPNVYRGFFPLQNGAATFKEGIDLGPDVGRGAVPDPSDPLCEATPMPPDSVLPGWAADIAHYYKGMERLGQALMRSIARGLTLPETFFEPYFVDGISTLRLIHYPVRTQDSLNGADPERVFVEHLGRRRSVSGAAHVDSGFVTLLAQDGVEGLQARGPDDRWIDVPPRESTLAVNFGKLLENWTSGRIKATGHRVLGPGRTRYSVPFFLEPRVDAVIEPLPIPGARDFAPFSYGDHLWAAMTRFVEFRALDGLRPPRGVTPAHSFPPRQARPQ